MQPPDVRERTRKDVVGVHIMRDHRIILRFPKCTKYLSAYIAYVTAIAIFMLSFALTVAPARRERPIPSDAVTPSVFYPSARSLLEFEPGLAGSITRAQLFAALKMDQDELSHSLGVSRLLHLRYMNQETIFRVNSGANDSALLQRLSDLVCSNTDVSCALSFVNSRRRSLQDVLTPSVVISASISFNLTASDSRSIVPVYDSTEVDSFEDRLRVI